MILAADAKVSQHTSRGIAGAAMIAVSLMHGLTPRLGVKIMNIVGVMKIIILLFIVITGWVVLGGGVSHIKDPHSSFRNAFEGSATSGNQYATALFKVLSSFAGFVFQLPYEIFYTNSLLQVVKCRLHLE
jgi:amino acid transporter